MNNEQIWVEIYGTRWYPIEHRRHRRSGPAQAGPGTGAAALLPPIGTRKWLAADVTDMLNVGADVELIRLLKLCCPS